MSLRTRNPKGLASALILALSLLATAASLIASCKDGASLRLLEDAERRFLSAGSYNMSGEMLRVIYYQSRPGEEAVYAEPFEMVIVRDGESIMASGYLDLGEVIGEIVGALDETEKDRHENIDPRVDFFLLDGYLYKRRFEKLSESLSFEERKWYKERFYPAAALASYDESKFLNCLNLMIGNEDWAEAVSENGGWIRYRLLVKDTLKERVMHEIERIAGEKTLYEIEYALDNKEFEVYLVVDKGTGLITSIEVTIKPFYVQQMTREEPLRSYLVIKADVSGYGEDYTIELPDPAREAEEIDDPISRQ